MRLRPSALSGSLAPLGRDHVSSFLLNPARLVTNGVQRGIAAASVRPGRGAVCTRRNPPTAGRLASTRVAAFRPRHQSVAAVDVPGGRLPVPPDERGAVRQCAPEVRRSPATALYARSRPALLQLPTPRLGAEVRAL